MHILWHALAAIPPRLSLGPPFMTSPQMSRLCAVSKVLFLFTSSSQFLSNVLSLSLCNMISSAYLLQWRASLVLRSFSFTDNHLSTVLYRVGSKASCANLHFLKPTACFKRKQLGVFTWERVHSYNTWPLKIIWVISQYLCALCSVL